jgi:hypothetical protein
VPLDPLSRVKAQKPPLLIDIYGFVRHGVRECHEYVGALMGHFLSAAFTFNQESSRFSSRSRIWLDLKTCRFAVFARLGTTEGSMFSSSNETDTACHAAATGGA